jgi:hypothetical protein
MAFIDVDILVCMSLIHSMPIKPALIPLYYVQLCVISMILYVFLFHFDWFLSTKTYNHFISIYMFT